MLLADLFMLPLTVVYFGVIKLLLSIIRIEMLNSSHFHHHKKDEQHHHDLENQTTRIGRFDTLSFFQNEHLNIHPEQINIIFENISYAVSVPNKDAHNSSIFTKHTHKKQILKNLTGIFKAGQVSAILGASGTGKTSFLNIIACRIPHHTEGKLYANHTEYNYQSFGDFANYVMQNDFLMETLTVRQTLTFAIDLKLNLSEQQKQKKLQELTKSMKLDKCLDVMVGGAHIKGISGGERKRTSIAFEIIRDPQVIVLDEPTSGLDSLTSFIIVDYLSKYAHQRGKTVLMTIHQPNTDIYKKFDRLFLMVQGQFVYQGPANRAVDYFHQNFGLNCGKFLNPAQFEIQITHQLDPKNVERYPQYFRVYKQKENPIVVQEIKRVENIQLKKYKSQVSTCTVFKALITRDFLNVVRNPLLFKSRLFITIITGIYVGGLYFAIGQKNYTDRNNWHAIGGFLYFITITSMMHALTPISVVFPLQRTVFLKEQNARLYSVTNYFLSRNIIEIPYLILMPLLLDVIFYWMIKLSPTAQQFFLFYLITVLINICGNSVGLLLGSLITDAKSVSTVTPIVVLPFLLFSGYFKNSGNIPGWIGWIQYISPLKYGFAAMAINEVKYRPSLIGQLNIDVTFAESVVLLIALALLYMLLSLFFLWLLRVKIQ